MRPTILPSKQSKLEEFRQENQGQRWVGNVDYLTDFYMRKWSEIVETKEIWQLSVLDEIQKQEKNIRGRTGETLIKY